MNIQRKGAEKPEKRAKTRKKKPRICKKREATRKKRIKRLRRDRGSSTNGRGPSSEKKG